MSAPKLHAVTHVRTLTPHLREILALAAQGLCAKAIARHFGTSPRTVTIQRELAAKIIGASNLCNAIAIAVEMGIVERKPDSNEWRATGAGGDLCRPIRVRGQNRGVHGRFETA